MYLKSACLLLAFLVFPLTAHAQELAQDTPLPNVVMILVDDSALMDFGIYGGEAQTPILTHWPRAVRCLRNTVHRRSARRRGQCSWPG